MQIRQAKVLDALAIARVHVDAWRSTYEGIIPDEYLHKLSYEGRTKLWLENLKTDIVFVALNDRHEIVGFATAGVKKTKGYDVFQGELYAIYILKEYQGMSIGKQLLHKVVEHLKTLEINSMVVLVLKKNPAVQFYKSLYARKIDSLTISIAGKTLQEEVYGWEDLEPLLEGNKQ
ncbi:GNAT family N-acetyltransferase [Oceanobacillus kapialis]|uniref:GNAT family N-acetyltransferase n=1 Tax=Oceanobacillus kapialis TaxID=481353 RepID=UPI00384AFA0C